MVDAGHKAFVKTHRTLQHSEPQPIKLEKKNKKHLESREIPVWNADCNMRINCIETYEMTSLKGVREAVLTQVILRLKAKGMSKAPNSGWIS